jgi:drug/metabolite transporter (DMT)-like permease
MTAAPIAPKRAVAPSTSSGVVLAVAAACSYGVTDLTGRKLAEEGMPSALALGVRFALAGLLLAAVLAGRGLPILPARSERLGLLLLGAVGYAIESMAFYLALERGTAAACTLLFYLYPTTVVVFELARRVEPVVPRTLGLLALAMAGAGAVVACGDRISISPTGVFFALAAASLYAAFLLVGRSLVRRTGPMTTSCWLALGAAASHLVRGAVAGDLARPTAIQAVWLLVYGLATAAAFIGTFGALARIGASRTAMILTLEAVVAVGLGVAFLSETLSPGQLLGGAAVVLAVGCLAIRGS